MKQFLRYIFTLAAMLMMVVGNAWAQKPIYKNGTWYSLYDTNTKTNVNALYKDFGEIGGVFAPAESMTFTYKKYHWMSTKGEVRVYNKKSDGNWSHKGSANYSDEDNWNTTSAISLDANISAIRYRMESGTGVKVKNHFIKLAKHIRIADGGYGKTSESKSFGNVTIGNVSARQTVKLRSFLTTNNITITSDNAAFRVGSSSNQDAHVFNVGANACASTNGKSGTPASGGTLGDINLYDINIYFVPTTAGEQYGTITITDETSTATIYVSGTGLAKETKFAWTIANTGAETGTFYVDDNAELIDIYTLTDLNGSDIKNELHSHISFATNNSAVVAIENGKIIAKSVGNATITAKFSDGHNGWKTFTKTLTLTINKHDLTASMIQTAVWNQTISDPFTIKCQNHSLLPDSYTITSLTPDIATYDATTNTIQTYFTDGTAYFQGTRPEDYKYNALNQTLTLTVNASTESCPILEDNKEQSWSTIGNSDTYTILSGTPDSLFFQANRTAILGVSNTSDFYAEYSTDNSSWTSAMTINLGSTDTWYDLKCDIPETAKYVRFVTYTGATGKKHIRNVRVTRKTFLNPQIDGETFYLTQVSSGMQFAGTFPLAWSTCSDEIRFSCDNPNFVIKALDSNNQPQDYIDASNKQGTTSIIVTYSANTANPVLTGELTIYDQSQTKTITLSCEHLTQTIDWPQYFHNLEADEKGVIKQDFTLNAIARAVNGQPTNQPIKYTLSVSPSENAQLSSDGRLIITGICEGTITASVEGFTDATSGITYSANSLTRQIRIRKAGTSCETYALEKMEEKTIGNVWPAVVYDITGLPANTMTFKAHAEMISAWNNEIKIDFKYNSDDQDWVKEQVIPIEASSENKTYTCYVPDSVKQVRFRGESSARSYFHYVELRQKTYITPSVSEITINTLVSQPFEYSFTVDYSDVPLIEYSVTNSNNLNLTLTPTTEINNNCGEHGTYTFILRGTSPYPQTGVTEYITITTSAHKDDPKIIPVTITSTLGDTYYFNQQDGDWSNLSNWQVNGIKPLSPPTPSNPVYISKAATVGANDAAFEGIAYSITIETGGSINVLPKGGLTVHAGGFTGADENNLTLHNKKDGAGFIRISPHFTGTMPTIKVLYETTSTLDEGANELAVWQYIGAPGADCQFTVDYITWLYHWSEAQGWINKTGNLTLEPFAGYAITQYGKPTYELVAKPINTNQTITLTKTDTGSGMDGDNLFANSFMAPIDVKNFIIEDFEGNIEATFYLFNSGSYSDWEDHKNNNNTFGDNHSVSPGQYCAIPALAAQYLPSDFDITTIPPMQGVYVIAKENNAKIHLDYNRHVWNTGTSTTDMHEPMRAPSHNAYQLDNFRRLRIQINSANSGADRMYVIQDTITTTDYDNGYDAPNQLAEGLANIYTNEHFGQMEISCSNHIDSTFIGFTAGSDSIYTLRFNAIIGKDLHLYDLDNDSLILLEEDATYTFHATPHSKNDLRFQILLHPEKNLDFGTEEKDELYSGVTDVHTTQVWSHGSYIYINNVPANTIATLYNISGHKLLATPIHQTPYTLDLSYLPKGVYMLQLNTQVYKFVIQ